MIRQKSCNALRRLFRKEADSLFDESEKGLLGREIALASRNTCPIQGRCVNGIITGLVIGPSGSGKSFFMNHLVRQYWEQNTHIILIDIGNSYNLHHDNKEPIHSES